MNTISIAIPSLPENIRIVESFIDNVKDKYQLNDDLYGNIMIAVTESVSNAISHGNRKDKRKIVDLSLHYNDSSIQFIIEDQGEGFDHKNLPDPTAPENLTEPSGRGIFLMKHLCDEVHFEKDGRRVELTFYLS
jgi:serine/threonine-protein kinase RsbW